MPAPAELHIKLMNLLQAAFASALDEAWDTAHRAVATSAQVRQPATPSPPTRKRIVRGYGQEAVAKSIEKFPDKGASRDDIRRLSRSFMGGQELAENTVKQSLKALRAQGRIELKDGRWWPVKETAARKPPL